jgi:hypothetical protein
MSVIARDHEEGLRKIRIVSSATPPSLPADTKEEVSIWMDPGRQFRFFRQEGGQWVPVASAEDSVYACAIRSIYAAMKAGGQEVKSSTKPTNANFQRDAYPLPEGRVFTIHLDGSDADSIESAKEFDLRWVRNDTGERSVRAMVSGKWVPSPDFNIMPMSTGRPRCFIRHNIDHQHKELDWLWTPDVALPRGEVTLFDGFDGTFEGFRVIRGGQGQYGQPQSYPIYRMLESVASAMSFIRTPLDSSGRVAGWGTPELWLHGGN